MYRDRRPRKNSAVSSPWLEQQQSQRLDDLAVDVREFVKTLVKKIMHAQVG